MCADITYNCTCVQVCLLHSHACNECVHINYICMCAYTCMHLCAYTQCSYTYVHMLGTYICVCVCAHGSHLYTRVHLLYTYTHEHVCALLKLKACFAQAHRVCPAVRWMHDSRTIWG